MLITNAFVTEGKIERQVVVRSTLTEFVPVVTCYRIGDVALLGTVQMAEVGDYVVRRNGAGFIILQVCRAAADWALIQVIDEPFEKLMAKLLENFAILWTSKITDWFDKPNGKDFYRLPAGVGWDGKLTQTEKVTAEEFDVFMDEIGLTGAVKSMLSAKVLASPGYALHMNWARARRAYALSEILPPETMHQSDERMVSYAVLTSGGWTYTNTLEGFIRFNAVKKVAVISHDHYVSCTGGSFGIATRLYVVN